MISGNMPLAAIPSIGVGFFIFVIWVHRKGNLPLRTIISTFLNFIFSLLRFQKNLSFSDFLFWAKGFLQFLLDKKEGDNAPQLHDMIEKQRAERDIRYAEQLRQHWRNELGKARERELEKWKREYYRKGRGKTTTQKWNDSEVVKLKNHINDFLRRKGGKDR